MYQLHTSTETQRVYRSSITGTDISTSLIHTDATGNKWWAFDDLLQIPHIRKMAANNISQLYGMGFTIEDLKSFTSRLKTILRSTDQERYEKAYSELLQLESVVENNIDPVKQELGLCSVYILSDSERVDTFSTREALEKMQLWSLDLDAQSFFLNWLTDGINDYKKLYSSITQIASTMVK
jgi:hypothetical protein